MSIYLSSFVKVLFEVNFHFENATNTHTISKTNTPTEMHQNVFSDNFNCHCPIKGNIHIAENKNEAEKRTAGDKISPLLNHIANNNKIANAPVKIIAYIINLLPLQ